MLRNFAPMLLVLMLSACGGRGEPQLVSTPAAVPDLPPAPVDMTRPVGPPMLEWLDCLTKSPWQLCRGQTSSSAAKTPMPTAPK